MASYKRISTPGDWRRLPRKGTAVRSCRINAKISEELFSRLEKYASAREITLSDAINEALNQGLP